MEICSLKLNRVDTFTIKASTTVRAHNLFPYNLFNQFGLIEGNEKTATKFPSRCIELIATQSLQQQLSRNFAFRPTRETVHRPREETGRDYREPPRRNSFLSNRRVRFARFERCNSACNIVAARNDYGTCTTKTFVGTASVKTINRPPRYSLHCS